MTNPDTVTDPLPATLARLAALPAAQAADAARADQDARWRAGERPPAEAYLAGLPAVAADPDQAMVLIYGEVLARAALGERPTEAEYAERFPHLADRIAVQFAVHAVLHPGTDLPTDTPSTGPGGAAVTRGGSRADPTPAVPEAVGPYRILGELGRGGMGLVYAAHDPTLDREVAVKTLFPGQPARPDAAARFVRESLITAKLPHPGIPPVYALGEQPDRTPYLAMKLVRGHTLEHLLRDRPHPATGGSGERGVGAFAPTPNGPPSQLSRFVGVFEQVCQAVGFAHSQRVVHRDLKPGNVMVGAFGEVQVMDWGLAKDLTGGVVESPAADAEASGLIPPPAGEAETQPGSILGTPAYMAPEQARGEPADPRADVFALGGVLTAVLTGRPPFVAPDARSTWRLAVAANTAAALDRLDGCGADPDLIELAKRCLAANPSERPADAGEVAKLVAEHRAGVEERLRRAELNRERAEVEGREQRKRRRVWQWAGGAVAAVLTLGVIGTTVGLIQAWEAKQRESDRANGEKKAKEEAVAAQTEALASARAATAAKEKEAEQRAKAEGAYDRVTEVLGITVSDIAGDSLATQKEISPEQKKLLAEVLKYYKEFAGGSGDDERSRYRIAKAAYQVGLIEGRLGRIDQSCAAFRTACDAFATLTAEHPTGLYRHCAALSHASLGRRLGESGKLSDAETHLRTAITHFERLAADYPAVRKLSADLAQSYDELGHLLKKRGNAVGASEQYRRGNAILERLAGDAPADPSHRAGLAANSQNQGTQLQKIGELKKAKDKYQTACDIYEQLVKEYPTKPSYRVNLARALDSLGSLLADTGDRVKGCEHLRRAIGVLEKVTAEYPSVPEYRNDLACGYDSLGHILDLLDQPRESWMQLQNAQTHWEELVSGPSSLPEYRVKLAASYTSLGLSLLNHGRLHEAREPLRKAVTIKEKLVTDLPTDPKHRTTLGGNYCNYGSLVRDAGDPADSLKWFEKAIRTLTEALEQNSRDGHARQFLRFSHLNRALAHDRLKRFADAVEDWNRGMELSPKAEHPKIRAHRATSLLHTGKVSDAVAEVADLTKSSNWNKDQWYGFAAVYSVASVTTEGKKTEYAGRAIELLRTAVAAGFRDHPRLAKDADLDPLRDRADFQKLLADLTAKYPPKREVLPRPRTTAGK